MGRKLVFLLTTHDLTTHCFYSLSFLMLKM